MLHIAADPNNLPFSNDKLEGFENKIATLIADDLGMRIQYSWRAQRRGFFRETMKEGDCDLAMGVPRGFDPVLTSVAYYRSTYALVYRSDRGLHVQSLDDPALKSLKVGVQVIGNDGVNTPPAHALAERGIVDNVVGYTIYADYAQPNPTARIMDAVASGDVDIAVVWGPLAGYFAQHEPTAITVVPLQAESEGPLQFAFDIAVGVKRGNRALRDQVNDVLTRRRKEIDAILDCYHVPRLEMKQPATRPSDSAAARPPRPTTAPAGAEEATAFPGCCGP